MKKLRRDYRRASDQLKTIITDIEERQRAEVSYLSALRHDDAQPQKNPHHVLKQQQEEEEEFFDRAMRERNDEVKGW